MGRNGRVVCRAGAVWRKQRRTQEVIRSVWRDCLPSDYNGAVISCFCAAGYGCVLYHF